MQKHRDAESLISCARDSRLDLELVVRSSAKLVRHSTPNQIEDVVNL